jgi:hypothetical protein
VRTNGSMMLMQALQNARPRLPQVASEPEPQASIYATKAANDGALEAWGRVGGLHDNAAERGNRAAINKDTLASALQRSQMEQQRALLQSAMEQQTAAARLGQQDRQFGEELNFRKERAPQEDTLKREEIAARERAAKAQAAARARVPAPPKEADSEKLFSDAIKTNAQALSNAMSPEKWTNVDARQAKVQKDALLEQFLKKQDELQKSRARYVHARFRNDRAAMERELAIAAGIPQDAPQVSAPGGTDVQGRPYFLRAPGAGGVEEFDLPPDAEQEAIQRAMARAQQGG